MAAEFFLYTTLYDNTLVNRSNTSFAPLPPETGEIEIDYFIPIIQPLYYYRESGSTIVLNSEETINEYLIGTAPPPEPDDNVLTYTFTGYTGTTDIRLNGMDVDISGNTTGVTANTAAINVSNELIVINYDLITGNTTGITTNKADISLLADEVAINITDIANNATGITENNAQITNNSAAITINAGNITGNTTYIDLVSGDTVNNAAAITINAGNITGNTTDITYISGVTDTKHNISDFNSFTGTTLPTNYYNKTEINGYTGTTATLIGTKLNVSDFNSYSASTDTRLDSIDSDISYVSGVTDTKTDNDVFTGYTATTKIKLKDKINTVTGATDNVAIFLVDGNVKDSGVSIDSLTGGTGHYYYYDKLIRQTTTSNTNIIYMSGSSGILEAGTWAIDFNAMGGNSSANKAIAVSFYIDNVIQGVEGYFKTNDSKSVMAFVVTKDRTLTAGTHTFEVRFRAPVGGTAILDYGSIRARIVN